jgi:hypothetical protein
LSSGTLPKCRRVPYMLRVSGFLIEPAEPGGPARVRTIIGRELSGTLKTVNPSYSHSFGNTVPELLTIGTPWDGAPYDGAPLEDTGAGR